MTNSVTTEQLKILAKLEESNRLLELRIIELKVQYGITVMEQQLSKNQVLAEKTRNELLEQEQAYVTEHGKAEASPYADIRASNKWVYDEDDMLENLHKDPKYARFIRTKTEESIIKADLKVYLNLNSLDEATELGAVWTEGYDVKLKPVGDLVISKTE